MKTAEPRIRPIAIVPRTPEDDEDAIEHRPLDLGIIRRLCRYTRPFAAKRNIMVALSLLRSMQLPALVWAMSLIISGPIEHHDIPGIAWGVAGYALLAFLTDFVFHFRQRLALELAEAVINSMRNELFAHVQRMPLGFFHRTKLGRIISRVTSDIESIRTGVQDVFFVGLVQLGQMIFVAMVMAWSDWVLFLVVVAMAPVLWVINRHFRVRLSRHTREAQESFSRVTANLAESVNGIRVTQGFVRQEVNAGFFRWLLADHSRYNMNLARTSAFLMPVLELNSQFFIAILLLLGGWRVIHHQMALDGLIQFFFLANFFFAPIQIIGNQYNQALVAMAGAERLFRLLDTKPDWEDDPAAQSLPDPRLPDVSSTQSSRGARIEFKQLSFEYLPGRPVLHDISFVAEPGATIALVGHTGSGKSSIINLVAKFYLPTEGELFIDGREIRTITSSSLHRQTGIVQQQNFLFTGTVLDNLRLGRPEASEEDVRVAARQLDCLDVFDGLPRGLQTEVGERGGNLSVGERQLICFTRALLADPRILILDEATSSIDAITEAKLQKALTALMRDRTSFVVAHRLSTIRHADLVLVLEHGRIIERGTHAELIAAEGRYARLHRQFMHIDART